MSVLLFAVSVLPSIALGLQGEGSAATNAASNGLSAFEYAFLVTVIIVALAIFFAVSAFCCKCCCFARTDDFYFKRKEVRDRATAQNDLESSRLIDSSCVVDIGNEIDSVNKNIDTIFNLIKNEFVLIDKAYSLIAHILVKSYFKLNPTKSSSSLVIDSFKEYLTLKYDEHLKNVKVRVNGGASITKEQFVVTELATIVDIIKNANEMDHFEEYLNTTLSDLNTIVSNFNSNNLSIDETISLFGGVIASGLACFKNTSSIHERNLVRQDYLVWADSRITGFPPSRMNQKVSMIAQSWDEAIAELK